MIELFVPSSFHFSALHAFLLRSSDCSKLTDLSVPFFYSLFILLHLQDNVLTGYLESTLTPQQLKAEKLSTSTLKGKHVAFNYEQLYENELDKKHKDK